MKAKNKKKIDLVEKILDGEKIYQAIRPDEKGKVDDVAIHCDLFRMERMDKGYWWCAVYRGDKRVCFSIYATVGKDVVVKVIEDEIGCIDDSKD
jgi:hypothetical protein